MSASALTIAILLTSTTVSREEKQGVKASCNNTAYNHVCIMKTIFGLDTTVVDPGGLFKTPEIVEASIKKGLLWMDKAQENDGGWGAGSHYNQSVMDPHAVTSDPATTSLVGMALLRTDNTLQKGNYSKNLKRALEFLLKAVEQCPDNQPYLTTLTSTQPQIKLGRNIDVILTAQFFTNLLRYDISDASMKRRIEKALDKCVARIQKGQDRDGSWKDGGWAP
ncbi:MAG TPA: hypothetical protein VIV15_09420, partial [Anaerolineales bacterium]